MCPFELTKNPVPVDNVFADLSGVFIAGFSGVRDGLSGAGSGTRRETCVGGPGHQARAKRLASAIWAACADTVVPS